MPREVEILITPTPAQYAQLVEDLEQLRAAGAESNTAAVCQAVREAATRSRVTVVTNDRREAA